MKNIIFIVGPTATAKTEVSYLLAKEIGAQIISCDSMLIYREPNILTSKPPAHMFRTIKHHFVSVMSVRKSFNAFNYCRQAQDKIIDLFKKDIPVIVCGGSGLYVKAILDGIFEGAGKDDVLRQILQERAETFGVEYLHRELQRLDPESAKKIYPQDLRRIIRALEVHHVNGVPMSQMQKDTRGLYGKFPIRMFGLQRKRPNLYKRINERVDLMFTCGILGEVNKLRKIELSITAKKMIGINEITQFLDNKLTEKQSKELMKKNTRNFAKRQVTWFKRDKRIEWIDADDLTPEQIKEKILKICTTR